MMLEESALSRQRCLIAVALLASLAAACPTAASAEREGDAQGWNGSIGAGPAVFPKYVGGATLHLLAIPLISVNYKETVYVELFRAGAVVFASADRKAAFGLAAEPRWGFHSSDGQRLAGMTTRRTSIEGGPTFDWESGLADVNVSYFTDLSNGTGGRSLRASLSRDVIKSAPFILTATVGIDHVDAALRNYYFGIRPSEATAARPAYAPGGGTDLLYGIDGSYAWDRHHSVVFGLNATRLSDSAMRSPIVERRNALAAWLGYAWRL
jgi:outer membrane protein